MQKYRDTITGTIHNVTNESLIPSYDADKRFVRIEETKPVKKTTAKKK